MNIDLQIYEVDGEEFLFKVFCHHKLFGREVSVSDIHVSLKSKIEEVIATDEKYINLSKDEGYVSFIHLAQKRKRELMIHWITQVVNEKFTGELIDTTVGKTTSLIDAIKNHLDLDIHNEDLQNAMNHVLKVQSSLSRAMCSRTISIDSVQAMWLFEPGVSNV